MSNKKLKQFYKDIARLTSHHDLIDDHACVTADKLGKALAKLDPDWWRDITPMTKQERKDQVNVGNYDQ